MITVATVSDTHNRTYPDFDIPYADVLIHAGDFTMKGSLEEIEQFADWFKKFPHPYKIVISGNHDRALEFQRPLAEKILTDAKFIYLRDSYVIIDGFKFYGSPWTPRFGHNWAYNADRGEKIKVFWDEIPDDTDVLITHGPAYGVLDWVQNDWSAERNVGCKDLLHRIHQLPKLKLHVVGHLHESYGSRVQGNLITVNTSICTLKYEPTNLPYLFELTEDGAEFLIDGDTNPRSKARD